MNKRSAKSIAIKSMQKELKQYAFNANLYKEGIVKSFRTEKDFENYTKLKEAIEIIKKL